MEQFIASACPGGVLDVAQVPEGLASRAAVGVELVAPDGGRMRLAMTRDTAWQLMGALHRALRAPVARGGRLRHIQ